MLAKQISQLDILYATSPSLDLYKERLSLQSEFDILMTQRTTEILLRTRSSYFEHGDKASSLLAHQLCKIASSNQIPKIRSDSGILTNPLQINSVFKEFLMSLYSSELSTDSSSFDEFFSNLVMPSIEQSSSEKLDQPITIEKLYVAVSSLQSGKSPGPDGYPVEFYKQFWQKLSPLLLDMFNESFEKDPQSSFYFASLEKRQGPIKSVLPSA